VVGSLTARKSGHALNQALVRKVLGEPAASRVVRVSAEADVPAVRGQVPAIAMSGSSLA